MNRLREGWWAMLVLCVGGGLWFLVMPLLGVGFEWQGIIVRPGWLGVPSCVFGAVYAANSTRWSRMAAVACGVALFLATWLGGMHFRVIAATNWGPCELLQSQTACEAKQSAELRLRDARSHRESRVLLSPLAPSTIIDKK